MKIYNDKTEFIHRVRKSSLLEIVEKSFPAEYGYVMNKDGKLVGTWSPQNEQPQNNKNYRYVRCYGNVKITDKEDSVVVEIFTPNTGLTECKRLAKVTFTDFDIKCESEINFPSNSEIAEIRFIDLMFFLFEEENYRKKWEEKHAADFSPPERF